MAVRYTAYTRLLRARGAAAARPPPPPPPPRPRRRRAAAAAAPACVAGGRRRAMHAASSKLGAATTLCCGCMGPARYYTSRWLCAYLAATRYMLYKNTMAAFLLVASSAAFTAVAGGMATATNETGRSIGWWWSCPATADDPRVDGMLRWAKEHTHILSTLIMHCGINTCDTNHSAPRGGNFSCLNNGGIGGTVSGELAPSGVRVLPELLKLGIKVELWLGEDDSRQSALHMFQGPAKVAQDLIAVAKAHPGISGFNLDTETAHSTAADAALSVPFLTEVTATLRSAEGGPYRFSTDVACSGGTGWCPMISDCALLARSGVDRIMNMATYNAPDFASWYQTALVPALGTGIPRSKLGAGLGVWNDSRTVRFQCAGTVPRVSCTGTFPSSSRARPARGCSVTCVYWLSCMCAGAHVESDSAGSRGTHLRADEPQCSRA
jgi:hypothetical protein